MEQQAYLKASNTGAGDFVGRSLAVSGDTVVVGAPSEASNARGVNGDDSNNNAPASGAAYVFVRSGNTWTQQAYLKAPNTGASHYFGSSVAMLGNSVVVGALESPSNQNANGGKVSAIQFNEERTLTRREEEAERIRTNR